MTFTRRSFLKSTALGLGVVAMPLTIHAKAAPADDFRQFMDGFSKAELDEIFPIFHMEVETRPHCSDHTSALFMIQRQTVSPSCSSPETLTTR